MTVIPSPVEAQVLADPVVGDGADGGLPAVDDELLLAVITVGLPTPSPQAQGPAPPGVLPALADDLPEEVAGLLQVEERCEI